jgi:cellulose 1,4-beta-cellobiosidase
LREEVCLNFSDLTNRDTIANIDKLTTELSNGVPCENILGLVIYDLPGRDCAAKASNGELAAGDVATYKSSYIDRKSTSSGSQSNTE